MMYKIRHVLSLELIILLLQIQCFYFNEAKTISSVPNSRNNNALIEIVLYEDNHMEGGYTTYNHRISGRFTTIGLNTGAEGDVSQVKSSFPCDSQSIDPFSNAGKKYGWVAFIIVNETSLLNNKQCSTLSTKAKQAIEQGATAVIFDITNAPKRANELDSAKPTLFRPVLVISDNDAIKMSELLLWKGLRARARIHQTLKAHETKANSNEYFDMGIFMAFFVLVSLICIGMLFKIKYRQRQKQTSLTRMALQAIARMETRKFTNSRRTPSSSIRGSNPIGFQSSQWTPFDIHSCAVCLEEFREGQDIRVVPCRHEFHSHCVDPWLLSNCTCPLCMLSIVEPLEGRKKKSTLWLRVVNRISQHIPWIRHRNSQMADQNLVSRRTVLVEDVPSSNSLQSVRTLNQEEAVPCLNTYEEGDASAEGRHVSHRMHFCRHHRKKQNKESPQRSPVPGSLLSDSNSQVDHSIVVVATFPQEKFDSLQEDLV